MSVTFAPVTGAARRLMNDRALLRSFLMIGVPVIALVLIGYYYMVSGRYVSTDNAYVKADMVSVSPDVGGRIVRVFVKQNEQVKAGDPLFQIDPEPYQLALAEADAQLKAAASNVYSMKAKYNMTTAQLSLAQSNVEFYGRELKRQSELAKAKFASQSKLDTARHNFDTAVQLGGVLKQSIAQIAATLDNEPDAPVEEHSSYRQAKATRDNAALNLARATVRAPFNGVLGKQPQVGDNVAPGVPVVSIVSEDHVWVEANFKETDLANVHPGQTATIDIDTYPHHPWTGRVLSISQATGSEFSVLPAQNATGNWVKVVQRIPVRIAIERHQGDPEVRAGMSVEAEIDTHSGQTANAGTAGAEGHAS
ncbi:MAG: HlyD family secretion protein [Parvibaculum sp.]|uniref:HlyD family secretion protein n=1 Tax=Parvibaculum sp. TaxID=2024848 RepID=UPI0025FDD98E|nr:HlyD family secretion protein [Parvibaculum sp.]MCE9649674.1 HlyD family secretion protein [Parvibaculum sp.]